MYVWGGVYVYNTTSPLCYLPPLPSPLFNITFLVYFFNTVTHHRTAKDVPLVHRYMCKLISADVLVIPLLIITIRVWPWSQSDGGGNGWWLHPYPIVILFDLPKGLIFGTM